MKGVISRSDAYSLKVFDLEYSIKHLFDELKKIKDWNLIEAKTHDRVFIRIENYYERLKEINPKEEKIFDLYQQDELFVPESYVANRTAQLKDFDRLLGQFRDVVSILFNADDDELVNVKKKELQNLKTKLNELWDADGPRHDDKLRVLRDKASHVKIPYTKRKSELSGPQLKAFVEALSKAFEPRRFDQLLIGGLNMNRVDISMEKDYITILWAVVKEANSHGWAPKLLHAARAVNPDNSNLIEFEKSLRMDKESSSDTAL